MEKIVEQSPSAEGVSLQAEQPSEGTAEITSIISRLNPLLGELQVALGKLNGGNPTFAVSTDAKGNVGASEEKQLTDEEKIANVKRDVEKYLEDKIIIKSFSQAENVLYEMTKIKKACIKLAKESKLVSKSDVEFWCENYYNKEYTRFWNTLPTDEKIVTKNLLSGIVEHKNGDVDVLRTGLTIGLACVTVFNTALLAFANSSVSLLIRMLEDAAEKKNMSLVDAEQQVNIINTSSNMYFIVAISVIAFLFGTIIVFGGQQSTFNKRKRIANRQLNIIKELESC